ncbi:hypothetical protein IGI04_023664, partial [Brassica rapa subsp. trilocularis]
DWSINKDFKDQILIEVVAWHWVGKVLCFVWKEKHFISTQHEKKKFALSHKEAIVLLLISLGDKSDKGEKKNCSFIRTWSFFPFPAMVDKGPVISLGRSLLRAGHQYPDYNIREYAKRRTLEGFRMNKNLTDHSKVEEAYAEGKKQLEVVERVVKVYLAYPPRTKNIMELKLQ